MMARTKIEWCTDVWNPITGCVAVSEGCQNCYAKGFAWRFWGERRFGEVRLHEDRLEQPLHWKRPRRVFVDSMGDLWHPDVQEIWLDVVFEMMSLAKRHTFLILTKRPRRALEWFRKWAERNNWPENVWLGTSIESQRWVDQRLPALLEIPVNLFVSMEPLIGPVHSLSWAQHADGWYMNGLQGVNWKPNMADWEFGCNRLRWVIVGGENGSGARPIHPQWVRTIHKECKAYGVPLFFKGWGEWAPGSELRGMSDELSGLNLQHTSNYFWPDGEVSYAVGRSKSGRRLDGVEWLEMPEF
ncbi:MAG: phage Gp37/Gp68 family protein [Armatimonadia bacterium]